MNDIRTIAAETAEILNKGFYLYDNAEVRLLLPLSWYEKTQIVAAEMQKMLEQNEKEALAGRIVGNGSVEVKMGDAFDIVRAEHLANALVLSFADPYIPGGSFLAGVKGQEQSLCRNSTLSAALNANEAKRMYADYQKCGADANDALLLVPWVDIIRDGEGKMLKHPVRCAVVSMPAINMHETNLTLAEAESAMKRKIRCICRVAAHFGYRELVLGAWGCGVFGHKAENMADSFYEVLFRENMKRYFSKIVFAIKESSADQEIFRDFKEKLSAYSESLMERLLKSRHLEYFKSYRKRLEEIDNFEQGHGKDHPLRVLMLVTFIVDELALGAESLETVYKAAAFHDAGRVNGQMDPVHGELGAKWYRQHCGEDQKVEFLIKYHSLDDEEAMQDLAKMDFAAQEKDELLLLYQILKDADALDRVRFKYYGHGALDEKFLRLKISKKLVSVAYALLASDLQA